MPKKIHQAELVENRIVVWNLESSRKIFSDKYFGKPLGIPKPKGDDFNAPLILDLIEGYHLLEKKKIKIFDNKTGKLVSKRKLYEKCEKEYTMFKEKSMVYNELRRLGYI